MFVAVFVEINLMSLNLIMKGFSFRNCANL